MIQRPLAAKLDQAIRAVAPHISGVSIGRRDQRETWRVNFAPEATPEQIEAAQAVIASFVEQDDPEPPRELAPLNVDEVIELIAHFMPEPRAVEPEPEPAQLLPPPDTLMADYGEVGETDEEITADDLLAAMRMDQVATYDAIAKLTREKRRRFTELLNIELAELQQLHGAAGENLKREGEIEGLLGLFASVGEL
jgi:hypothetical protein